MVEGYVVLESLYFASEYINSLHVNAPLIWKVKDREEDKREG
jgi:hypothetical protein